MDEHRRLMLTFAVTDDAHPLDAHATVLELTVGGSPTAASMEKVTRLVMRETRRVAQSERPTPTSVPLLNRGPEALQALLAGNDGTAHVQVRHLTLSELVELTRAAGRLAELAAPYITGVCQVCEVAVRWDPDEPTGQGSRWRHVDQAASYAMGAHRPVVTTNAKAIQEAGGGR